MNQILYQADTRRKTDYVATGLPERGGGLCVGQAHKSPFGSANRFFPKALWWIGDAVLLIAVAGLAFSFGPLIKSELVYRFRQEAQTSLLARTTFADLLKANLTVDTLAAIAAPDSEFSVVIPKIQAESRVIANVNAADPREYNAALQQGVAHAAGTVLPGMRGTVFLFAHSTDAPWNIRRFNAVFYLLRELEPAKGSQPGDQIVVFFLGRKYFYEVVKKEIVSPTETAFFSQKEEEILVLQTCYPPGTTEKALLITAKRIGGS